MRGVSDLARMTPEAVEAKYGVPPHRYPELAALVGEDSDNLPGVPGVGPKTRRQVDQPVRRPRQRDHPRRRDHGQGGRVAARAPRPTSSATASSTRWSATSPSRSTPADLGRAALGPPARSTSSSTAWSSGCCATGSSRRSESEEEIDEVRLRPRRPPARARRASAAGWPQHAPPGERVGVAVQRHLARRAPARSTRVALAAGDGHGRAGSTSSEISPEDDAALAGWLGRPGASPRCCTTPRARCWRWPRAAGRWPGSARDTALVGLPRPARPALLRPGRPDPALPQARAQAGAPSDDGQLSFDSVGRRRRGRDTAMLHARDRARPGRGARRASSRSAAAPACWPTSSCRWCTCWPGWSRSASPSTSSYLEGLEAEFAGEVQRRGRGGVST